ncbi:MAG: hypothetical protein WCJ99_14600 [Betaproteobacteria bacterium]
MNFFQTPLSSHGNSLFACELQTFGLAASSWVGSLEVIRRWGGRTQRDRLHSRSHGHNTT